MDQGILASMKKRKTYTAEQKSKAVLALLKGEQTQLEIARALGCHPNLLNKWREHFVESAPALFAKGVAEHEDDSRIAELERMIGKLTVQYEFLKKVSGRMD